MMAKTVREHARARGALDGADAQALEGALTTTERERNALRAELAEWRAGKRRVSWRVKANGCYLGGRCHLGGVWWSPCDKPNAEAFRTKKAAFRSRRECGGDVYRVTVGPAKPKGAK